MAIEADPISDLFEIDYSRVSKAIDFYKRIGFQYVEVPWVVPSWALDATAPPGTHKPAISPDSHLVASAEQSFIYLDAIGALGKGAFVAATPCFRPNDNDGDLHQPCFMKVELYRNDTVDLLAVFETIYAAADYFGTYVGEGIELVTTEQGFDLELGGIEIGSYGSRAHGALAWVYGTGIAEPRFSTALNRYTHDQF